MTEPKLNTMREMIDFFSCEGRPVTAQEFNDFWKSLTDDQKAYYKSADLT